MLSEKPRGGLSESRKVTKSTMEKKRRARINNSLTELKAILAGMISNKGERFDKMEKADILEMTVKCVRQLQKQTSTGEAVRSSPGDEDYRSGMHTCMSEVLHFINSSSFTDSDPEVKTKLLDHLANKLHSGSTQRTNIDSETARTFPNYTKGRISDLSDVESETVTTSDFSNDSNNNLQTMNDKSSPISVQINPKNSPQQISPLQTSMFTPYRQIQPLQDAVQQTQSVPTVPLTILVPANICSATVGTTCVIPLNLPTASPNLGQNNVLTTGQTSFIAPAQNNILATVTQPSQGNYAMNSASGISLIPAQSFYQNVTPSSKESEHTNVSPESRIYTFTPTVITDTSSDNISKTNTIVKSTTHPYAAKRVSQQDDANGTTALYNTNIDDTISNFNLQKQVGQIFNKKSTEFQGQNPFGINSNEKRLPGFQPKHPFRENRSSKLNQTLSNKIGEERPNVGKEHFQHQGETSYSEPGQLTGTRNRFEKSGTRSYLFNSTSKPSDNCDENTGMWRPW